MPPNPVENIKNGGQPNSYGWKQQLPPNPLAHISLWPREIDREKKGK